MLSVFNFIYKLRYLYIKVLSNDNYIYKAFIGAKSRKDGLFFSVILKHKGYLKYTKCLYST